MRKLGTRDVNWSDLEEISDLDLMDDDLMEVLGTGQSDIPAVLVTSCISSFKRTCRCIYVIDTGEIIGVYGVTVDNLIWFLSDKRLIPHYKEFIKYTKEEFEKLVDGVHYAYNFVHWYHKRAKRWLAWLGFKRTSGFYEFPPQREKYMRYEFMKERICVTQQQSHIYTTE